MPNRTDACLALLAVLAIVAALLLPWGDAAAQTPTPGVGLPGVPRADFDRTWCQQHRPGGCSPSAPPAFDCSVCPSSGWLGYYAEFFPRAQSMLRGCWEVNAWGTKATHDGLLTPGEFNWAQVGVPRGSTWYRECWYEREQLGGSPANALVIATEADAQNWSFVVDAAKAAGAWREGIFSYKGFDPVSGGWRAGGAWPVWVDNRLTIDPPPAPAPAPPPPAAECEPYAGSACQAQCERGYARGWRPWDREWCLSPERDASKGIGALCAPVCRVEPEPPPPPPPVRDARLEIGETRFVPGLPSTGRLEIDLSFPLVPAQYEVQVCRGGAWSESYEVAALPGDWVVADAGECGVRWREVAP